ncbi:MAG TPA: hydroxymethylglutaryl-CoA reductase, degradative [Anaerolineaceae bacterium]|nr:hydroxymethylglutaryl-CoA reductase, degradative [Anaerolineaceae bacterium]
MTASKIVSEFWFDIIQSFIFTKFLKYIHFNWRFTRTPKLCCRIQRQRSRISFKPADYCKPDSFLETLDDKQYWSLAKCRVYEWSRITLEPKKFYQMSLTERREWLQSQAQLSAEDIHAWSPQGGLSAERADHMIENAVGVFALPLGIAQNFLVNGRKVLVPMAVEEPSILAGVSFMARLAQAGGGFFAWAGAPEMIAQIQLLDIQDMDAAQAAILAHKTELLTCLKGLHPTIEGLGGGARDLQVRRIENSAIGPFLVVHLIYDVRDVMGANAVNSAAEALAGPLEQLTGGRAHVRILSNLADRRLARAEVRIPSAALAFDRYTGEQVRDGILEAWAFAAVDPYRAATHNKGIMNGVDAVVIATGNDWRGVEAGAHSYAARAGTYTSLSTWSKGTQGELCGALELPLALGITGGSTQSHPTARANLRLINARSAGELAGITAAVGLAQNLAALRALATEGIQRGHMRLHARQVALSAGASPEEAGRLAAQLAREGNIRIERAREILDDWRKNKHD